MQSIRKTRNCFISYHHDNDKKYILALRRKLDYMKVSDRSLKNNIGHLADSTIYKIVRTKMRNCSVTIILIGNETGNRKWIDWEIWASLRAYNHPTDPFKSFKPNGLLAIFLPRKKHVIPERLQDNIDSGYAVSMKWENLERDFERKVNFAFWRRTFASQKIENRRERMEIDY
jgi:hypothetical protein